MNGNALNSAVNRLSKLDERERASAIANFSPEDRQQIATAINKAKKLADDQAKAEQVAAEQQQQQQQQQPPTQPAPPTLNPEPAVKTPPKKNEGIDLSPFDYNTLEGDMLKKYFELVGRANAVQPKLMLNQQYTYEQYKAYGTFEFELDKSTGKPVKVLSGIKLRSTVPVMTTQIACKDAMLMNAQIENSNQLDMNAKFFLLKK